VAGREAALKKLARNILIAALCLVLVGGGIYAAFIVTFVPTREVVYREMDDVVLKLQIFEPEGPASGPRPAILFFFGGGWTAGSPIQFYPWADHFASIGWIGITAEYRVRSRHGTSAFAAVDDARAAYRFLHENADTLGIDPARIVLAGCSAGGHLAAAVVIPPWPERGELPDPAGLVLLNPALDTRIEEEEDYLAGVADLFEGRGEEISPLHHVRAGLPRTLVVHGTADGLVPFEKSRDFCERMRAEGNTCELAAYEGASHGFFNWGLGSFDEVLSDVVSFTAGR
jgi:acetyl esterase/lipase